MPIITAIIMAESGSEKKAAITAQAMRIANIGFLNCLTST
jgi:hypothetical protein